MKSIEKIRVNWLEYILSCSTCLFHILDNNQCTLPSSTPMMNKIRLLICSIRSPSMILEDIPYIRSGLYWISCIAIYHKLAQRILLHLLWTLQCRRYNFLQHSQLYNSQEVIGRWHQYQGNTPGNSRYIFCLQCGIDNWRPHFMGLFLYPGLNSPLFLDLQCLKERLFV